MKRQPPPAPSYEELMQIVRLIESGSRFREFRLRCGDIEVEVKRANGAEVPLAPVQRSTEEAPAAPAARQEEVSLPADSHVVRAPMVGTFYHAPAPGAEPFVAPGTRVAPDTVVCIIEVMKLMNSIEAGVAGVVTQVLVKDAQSVEYGQPLIAIDPDR